MNCSVNVKSIEGRTNYSNLEDQDLIHLIGKNQDRAALAEIYERYKLPVGSFLKRKACESRTIDEVYNDVMMVVWEKASRFRGESKVSTWLFGIAYRVRLSHGRKEKKHSTTSSDEVIDDNALAEHCKSERETSLRESIQAALEELSEPHRVVIELAYFHGYSTAEISKIVSCPANTVKTRLFHARKKLRSAIELEESFGFASTKRNPTKGKSATFSPNYGFC